MEKEKNKMTMEKLAEMTQQGFKALEDGLENKVGGLENRMDGKFNKLLTGQDQILKRLEDLEADNTIDVSAHRRQEDKLENHEERIIVVEEKLEIDSVV